MRIKTITLAIVAAAVSSCTQTPELNTTPRNSTISDNSSQTPYSIHNFVQIFPKENSNPITLEGTLPNGEKIITQTQFEKLKNALVGSRQIVIERDFAQAPQNTWQLMALRFEPCSPLGLAPFQLAEQICEPELRLVFQPVLRNYTDPVQNGSNPNAWPTVPYFALDKGIHMLFDGIEAQFLSPEETRTYQEIKAQFLEAVKSQKFKTSQENPLSPAQISQFNALRKKIIHGFKAQFDVLLQGIPLEDTQEINKQAGFYTAEYKNRLLGLLATVGGSSKIKQLTLFTVNEAAGAERPASNWGGSFVSMVGEKGNLVRDPQNIFNSQDGTPIVTKENNFNQIFQFSDVKLQNVDRGGFAIDPFTLLPCTIGIETGRILAKQSLVGCGNPFAAFKFDSPLYPAFVDRVSKRTETLIPNTSCMSCHSIDVAYEPGEPKKDIGPNSLFNFHNLSELSITEDVFAGGQTVGKKFSDLGFRVSKRVKGVPGPRIAKFTFLSILSIR